MLSSIIESPIDAQRTKLLLGEGFRHIEITEERSESGKEIRKSKYGKIIRVHIGAKAESKEDNISNTDEWV